MCFKLISVCVCSVRKKDKLSFDFSCEQVGAQWFDEKSHSGSFSTSLAGFTDFRHRAWMVLATVRGSAGGIKLFQSSSTSHHQVTDVGWSNHLSGRLEVSWLLIALCRHLTACVLRSRSPRPGRGFVFGFPSSRVDSGSHPHHSSGCPQLLVLTSGGAELSLL